MENTNVKTNTVSAQKKYKKRTPMGEVWHRLKKNKGAMVGGAFVLLLVFVALFRDVIYDYDTQIVMQDLSQRLIHPCWEHPFGTDNLGRDLFARVVYGTGSSLPVGVVAVLVALAVALVLVGVHHAALAVALVLVQAHQVQEVVLLTLVILEDILAGHQ